MLQMMPDVAKRTINHHGHHGAITASGAPKGQCDVVDNTQHIPFFEEVGSRSAIMRLMSGSLFCAEQV